MNSKKLKVAIVCDWLDSVGGAEQVLREFCELYPEAPIYTSVYRPRKVDWFKDREVKTGWLNVFPTAMRKLIPALRIFYFRRLDLSDYDLVISVTGAEAKGVKTRKDALHISYMHAPTQYYWQKYEDYIKDPGFGLLNPLARISLKCSVGELRQKDLELSRKADFIIVPSNYIKSEIQKYYKRDAKVIFPPVDVEELKRWGEGDTVRERKGFIVTSRQVPWKRLDLAVQACIRSKQMLTLVGGGSEHKYLRSLARGHEDLIKFLPTTGPEGVKKALYSAEAYIFPSLEPFGIAPIEALATGMPVLAYGEGGALDYIKDGENGILFKKQTVSSLAAAIQDYRDMKFDSAKIIKSTEDFSKEAFRKNIKKFIDARLAER